MKLSVLACVLALSLSCSHPPVSLSPAGARLYQANEVVVAIGTLQHAAIELNKTQVCNPPPCHALLADANTRIVVDAVADGLTTIKATPDGWKAATSVLLDRITARLDAAGKTELAGYVQAVKTIAGI